MYCIEIPTRNGQIALTPMSEGLILRLPAWAVKFTNTYHICGFRCVKLD